MIVGAVALLAALALGVVFVQGRDGSDAASRSAADLFEIQRGGFDIVVPASGELEAAQQIEIRNQLEVRAVISEVVDEGLTVKKGDLLILFNDEEIRNRIKDAEDAVNSADSSYISAQANLAIRQNAAESELARAQLDVELATLALDAWREGEVEATREALDLAVTVAMENYSRLADRYEQSRLLQEQEFISHDELRRDKIAMIEAEARVKQAVRDQKVYEEFTYLQEKKQKESDLKQAEAELERVKQRHAAELETARADVRSRKHNLESQQERLDDLRVQLKHCTVVAPSDGLVVYASSMESHRNRRGGQVDPPQVGTELSRNELVMILPDTSRMVAAVKVNEALSGMIEPGQQARVVSDAVRNRVIEGEVVNVGILAESGGWRDPNRRDYTVRIALNGANEAGLRPSMRARADIFVDRVEDAVYAPVQAIFRDGRRAHVYVPAGRHGFEARPVQLGRASELYVEVLSGLEPGEHVLLRRPSAGEIVGDALEEATAGTEREQRRAPAERNGNQQQGKAAPVDQATTRGPQGGEGRGQRPQPATE